MIVLGNLGVAMALQIDEPDPLTSSSSTEEVAHLDAWKRSNQLCMGVIRQTIATHIKDDYSDKISSSKWYLEQLEKRFGDNGKSKINSLLSKLISTT